VSFAKGRIVDPAPLIFRRAMTGSGGPRQYINFRAADGQRTGMPAMAITPRKILPWIPPLSVSVVVCLGFVYYAFAKLHLQQKCFSW
jgi:hypothetical protein